MVFHRMGNDRVFWVEIGRSASAQACFTRRKMMEFERPRRAEVCCRYWGMLGSPKCQILRNLEVAKVSNLEKS